MQKLLEDTEKNPMSELLHFAKVFLFKTKRMLQVTANQARYSHLSQCLH